MLIKTRDFGEITISADKIISFPNGIYAFEEYQSFVLISPCGEDVYPMFLQSVDNESLCFVVFNPKEFVADYYASISVEDAATISSSENDVLDYLVIAVVPDDYRDSTANFKSPIVINSSKNKAVQVIALENYPIKFPLFSKEDN